VPSWNDLLTQIEQQPGLLMGQTQQNALKEIGKLRGDRNVILYASAFLQKPDVPPTNLQITHEDLNGFMAVMHGMNWSKGLTIILHTPGGVTNAAESIVAYLLSKFGDIEVIVPTLAMSAGTMISLAANRVVMGRQSQLGPIDPQMPAAGRYVSAQSIVDQFGQARSEILADKNSAHVWAPILQSVGPALLQEASNALAYSETMVARWLEQRMFHGSANPKARADATAKFFRDASVHKSHGRRIDRYEAKQNDVTVDDLEDSQELQEAVLTSYHMATLFFERSSTVKIIEGSHDKRWVKSVGGNS